MTTNELISVAAASELIRRKVPLAIAGPEVVLDQLPAGDWIAGTIPYFMVTSGGTVVTDDRVFVTDLSSIGNVSFASYGADELAGISRGAPQNGFAFTIIPAGSASHQRFAKEAAGYELAFLRPTVGWIAGVDVRDIGRASAKVYDGRLGRKYTDRAVVAYVELPADKLVSVEILNIFEPDGGDRLQFHEAGFRVRDCLVNGREENLAKYLERRGLIDGKLPLVGDFAGAHVNVSIQSVDQQRGTVELYAPVFNGVDYRVAKPVSDYAATFRARLEQTSHDGVVLGCNCILNFLFGELEGKAIGGVQGPVTFGEIAYQLLNQTMVMLRIV